ncbi:MAG TPA: PEGA domain-containing protein [Blastocatellia bacterium]|jgi:hypothetical protein|nr:PEGA domain-containing protein [Blastocatellia bacterium]
MVITSRTLLLATAASSLMAVAGCRTPGTNQNGTNPQRNTNTARVSTANGNAAANANKPALAASAQGGTIDVKSTPAGASVLLIRDEDGSAGQPKPYGSTPATLTGIAPGKYTVDIEKPGFKFYQKEVEVKKGGTVKIDAKLAKH